MARWRIALAQLDLTVGDVEGNAALMREWTARAAAAGAQLVAFPEMALTGYPAEDLVYRDSFLQANDAALAQLAAESGEVAMLVGHLAEDGGRRNAVSLLHEGAVRTTYYKHFLPNYGVFDERRYFVPGDRLCVVSVAGLNIAPLICEDLWQPGGPVGAVRGAGVDLAVVINASPYEQGKSGHRRDLVARRAAEAGRPFAYVNTVGGQDELVFDGDSMVVTAGGEVVARAPRFVEHLLLYDLEVPQSAGDRSPHAEVAEPLTEEAEVWSAVVLGTRDYVAKNGFRSVVLGLSGGIDSAVTAAIAVDAVGADAVHTVAMPSSYSSEGSLSDAADLAERTGVRHGVIPIQPVVEAYAEALKESGGLTGVAAENLQARARGTLLMALSNEHGHLVLTTGNKSELATGFSTLYGDSAGGFAPIKDVPKSLVWRLARWRNSEARRRGETEPIPERVIAKPPSAELAPGQLDSDRLPAYDVLDAVFDDYVEADLGRSELVAKGHDPGLVDRVIRLVDAAEYKRRQYPPGPKISTKSFGRDRRLPITSAFREGRPGD